MYALPELQGIARGLNVDGYVSKPFDLHEFLDVMDNLLRTGTR